jgi:hypothetical protein
VLALSAGLAGFAITWLVCESFLGFDRSTAITIGGVVGPILAAPFLLAPAPLGRSESDRSRRTAGPGIQPDEVNDGYLFICYSHGPDDGYVQRLGGYLREARLPFWYDREVVSGDRWADVIRGKIDNCAAILVVMTPEAEESRWVAREIAHAERISKPIVPLLLRGEPFFSLADVQYESVVGDQIPGPAFLARMRGLLGRPASPVTHAVPAPAPTQPPPQPTTFVRGAAPVPSRGYTSATPPPPPTPLSPTARMPVPVDALDPARTRRRPWVATAAIAAVLVLLSAAAVAAVLNGYRPRPGGTAGPTTNPAPGLTFVTSLPPEGQPEPPESIAVSAFTSQSTLTAVAHGFFGNVTDCKSVPLDNQKSYTGVDLTNAVGTAITCAGHPKNASVTGALVAFTSFTSLSAARAAMYCGDGTPLPNGTGKAPPGIIGTVVFRAGGSNGTSGYYCENAYDITDVNNRLVNVAIGLTWTDPSVPVVGHIEFFLVVPPDQPNKTFDASELTSLVNYWTTHT